MYLAEALPGGVLLLRPLATGKGVADNGADLNDVCLYKLYMFSFMLHMYICICVVCCLLCIGVVLVSLFVVSSVYCSLSFVFADLDDDQLVRLLSDRDDCFVLVVRAGPQHFRQAADLVGPECIYIYIYIIIHAYI